MKLIRQVLCALLGHGVRWLNARASHEFQEKYPALNEWIGKFMRTADDSAVVHE